MSAVPRLAWAIVELLTVVVVKVVVAEKIFNPAKVWLPLSLAMLALSERLADERPVIVAPVTLRVLDTVKAPIVEVL